MGMAPMPTQNGEAPGEVSMSGGWTWSIPRKSENPDLAWKLIQTCQTKKNALEWCVAQLADRRAQGRRRRPEYLNSLPGIKFFTERVEHTSTARAARLPAGLHRDPGGHGGVTTGDSSVGEAAESYDEQLLERSLRPPQEVSATQ